VGVGKLPKKVKLDQSSLRQAIKQQTTNNPRDATRNRYQIIVSCDKVVEAANPYGCNARVGLTQAREGIPMAQAKGSLSQPFFTENSPAMAKWKPKIIRKPVAPPLNEWPSERNS